MTETSPEVRGPEPYYEDEVTTLYLGDCRQVLPALDLTVDLLVTDPPYGQAYRSNRGQHADIVGDDGTLPLSEWLPLALKRLRRGRHAYIFGARDTDIVSEMHLCGRSVALWAGRVIEHSEGRYPMFLGAKQCRGSRLLPKEAVNG
jgi:DNA modification methylase